MKINIKQIQISNNLINYDDEAVLKKSFNKIKINKRLSKDSIIILI